MTGRIRTVKPEWLEDELLAAASDEARVLSIALILMSDDYGRGRASLAAIAAGAWRYQMERADGAHAPEILARASRALRELVEIGFVVLYDIAKQRYFEIRNWSKHQKVDRPSKPRIPAPSDVDSLENAGPRDTLATPSRASREPLATDLRPPTSDQRSPTTTAEQTRAQARPAALPSAASVLSPVATPAHVESFERSFAAPTDAHRAVAEVVSETRQTAGGAVWHGTSWKDREALQKLAEWVVATSTPPDRLRALLAAFWGAKGTGARLSWLVEEDPGRFLGSKITRAVGMTTASDAEEHARDAEAGPTLEEQLARFRPAVGEGRTHG